MASNKSKKSKDDKTEERLKRLTEERLKQIEEKIKKLEEAQRESPDKKASGGVAGEILRSIGEMVPGLGDLIEDISKSPAFQKRLEKINEELDRRLRETPLKKVEGEVSGGVSRRPIGIPPGARGTGPSTAPTSTGKLKHKRPGERLAAEAPEEISVDVFDEDSHIMVIAELPGVAERNLEVKAQGRTLSIIVTTQGAKCSQEVELPSAVQGEPQHSLNKGILRIRLEKAGTDD